MKSLLLFLLFSASVFAQTQTELTPTGFTPVTIARPETSNEKLIEITRSWADVYNKIKYDVYNVTVSSVTVDGFKENAFFYRNRGEVFKYSILYSLEIRFGEKSCSLQFSVKQIFADRTEIKSTITDYFTPEGTMKEGFENVKVSVEDTANKIIQSYLSALGR